MLGRDAWRLQLAHPDSLIDRGVRLNFAKAINRKPSAGILTFIQALAVCDSVKLFGFFGEGGDKHSPYHAYKWCDVDRIFNIASKDCKNLHDPGNVKRTETGMVSRMSTFGHDFGKEKAIMTSRRLSHPSSECRTHCRC